MPKMYARRSTSLGDGLFDFGDTDFTSVPTTSAGAIDFGQIGLPAGPDLSVLTPPTITTGNDLASLAHSIANGAQLFFGTQAQITNAQTAAQLAKARGQAAVAVAKAGGANAAKTAGAGLPSPTLLLFAGVGLAAILVLRK